MKKKVISLLLASVMVLSMASCGKKDGNTDNTDPGSTEPSSENTGNVDPSEPDTGLGNDPFSGHPLGHFEDDGKTYTYHSWTTVLPAAWNVQTYENNEATTILNYTSDSLYTYEFTEDYSTFVIVPSMASDYATDVTSDYVGQYGIEAGDVNKAWSIPLKQNLKFDNGDPITANTFVESIKLLLNPAAQNGRADDFYMDTFKPYNAENYLKQGAYGVSEFVSASMGEDEYVDPALFTADEEGYLQHEGKDIIFDVNTSGNWYGPSWADLGFDESIPQYAELVAAADENGRVKLTADLLKDFQDLIAMLHGYDDVDSYAAEEAGDYAYIEFEEAAFFGMFYPEMDFSEVGVFAPNDYELVIVIRDPMEDNYYLRSALASSFFLVHPDLYTQCIDESTGIYTNTYGTSLDTYVGFGPYKLTEFVEGSYVKFERNLDWHGYADGEYLADTYMADGVRIQLLEGEASTATAHEMFLKGELDSFGLSTPEYINEYLSSEYTVFTDSESTWLLVMNPGMDNFERTQAVAEPMLNNANTVNKTIMTLPDFRKALSYALDRQEFILATVPSMKPAAYVISKVCVADPETMQTYRSYDVAKDAVLNFWGLADDWGDGKEYADRDEAIDSITGYDPEGAKVLFDAAYDQAVEQGLLSEEDIASGNWEVQIIVGLPSEAKAYVNGGEFLQTAWTNAVQGTKFENHLSVKLSDPLGSTWSAELKNNGSIDVLFLVGWGGDPMDPYGLFGCTVDPNLQYDTFTDKTNITYDVEINGQILRASYYAWIYEALKGQTITAQVIGADGNPTGETVNISAGSSDPAEVRVAITAAGEEAIMNLANLFPLASDASASLRGMRMEYVTYEYNLMMAFGGIAWNKFLMDDDEFAQYVASQGGTLNYK